MFPMRAMQGLPEKVVLKTAQKAPRLKGMRRALAVMHWKRGELVQKL